MLTDVPPEYITNASDRFAIEQKGVRWSQEWADRVVHFANTLFTSQFVEGKFRLLPWQEWFLRKLYGFRRADGKRAFRSFLIFCGKKNGKTLLISIVAAFEAFAAGVNAPRVAVASTTQLNAEQVSDEIRATLKNSPLGKFCKVAKSKYTIEIPAINGRIFSLALNASAAEGLPLSCCLIDEFHAHTDKGKLYRALRYNTKSRRGIVGIISTAGEDLTHPFYGLYQKAKRIANSEEIDHTFLPLLFEPDEGADPTDPIQWHKANPSLGVSQELEDFELEMKAAQSSAADWMSWRRYSMNQWVRPEETAFIDLLRWDECRADIPETTLTGCPCWMGFDGSTSIDPSSASLAWLLPDGRFHVRSWAWVCEKGVKERDKINATAYREYIQAGSMTMTPGDFISHTDILAWMKREAKRWKVKGVRMDGNNCQLIGETLMSEGYAVEFVPQSARFWNWPLREWERAVLSKRLTHDGSRWLRDCCGHLRAKINDRDELRPVKSDPTQKIDGFVSACLAFTPAAMEAAKPKPKARIEVW